MSDELLMALQGNGGVHPANDVPAGTVRAGGHHHALVMANRAHSNLRDADTSPTQTATTGEGGALAVVAHYDPGWTRSAAAEPIGSVTTTDHHSVVVPLHQGNQLVPVGRQPLTAVATRNKTAVVMPYGADAGRAREATTATITTHNRHALVVPPPAELVTPIDREWTDADIDACGYRMFVLPEIAGAMVMRHHTDGTPYRVLGNQSQQMAQYGNSVTPNAMALLVSRLLEIMDFEAFIDLFCGAGGSSLGAAFAGARLRLGLNHDSQAVETHATNFQDAEHDCEDISSLTTRQIKAYLRLAGADFLIGGPECTNHTTAKGAARVKPQAASLFDDGPIGDAAQEKSRATMWDMVRFAEQALLIGKPFKAIVVENVTDAFKWGANDDGGLFNAWLMAFDAIGYRHEIVWLNSMFAHVPGVDLAPQSRDRMYVVLTLKTMKVPDLRFEPIAYCPHCEKAVYGQQTWKRTGERLWRPHGCYDRQYIYACPECRRRALPGAAPASTVIDDTIKAKIIAERKPVKCKCCGEKKLIACNTRGRIRRGLTRLDREPFAIRLTHGGIARPITLPLVTLTTRHDMALVMPVSGNTFERTPGNRARRADTQPVAAVNCTEQRAIVVPPMGNVDARPAGMLPAPTQTTTTRAAVVTPEPAA